MKTRRIIITVIVVAVLVGGFFVGRKILANRASEFLLGELQTEKAKVGPLEATIGATGTVRSNQSIILNWQTTGIVDEVNIGVGQEVTAGEILASLKQSSLPQNVILAQADLVNAQQAFEDLLDSYKGIAIVMAEKDVADLRDTVDNAKDYLDDINYVGEQKDIDKANVALQKAYDKLVEAESKRDSYNNKNSYGYLLAEREYRSAYSDYASKLSDYNYLTGQSVNQIEKAIAEADLAVAEQRLADAEEELARLKAGPESDEIAAAEARIAAAQASIELAWIESPFAGVVTQVDVKPGDRAVIGTPAFRVDDFAHLLVDVDVSEVDINRVEVGQPVILEFDAILAAQYEGQVVEVSPVGNIVQGVVNFKVTIELLDPDEKVKPGMTAAVNIVVSQLENVLQVPNRAVRVVDGNRVVYLLKGGQLEKVDIELGASADLYSEVVGGGLEEGDNIVLNPPSEFMTGDGPPAFMRN
jgi:HlyD family secretion protein